MDKKSNRKNKNKSRDNKDVRQKVNEDESQYVLINNNESVKENSNYQSTDLSSTHNSILITEGESNSLISNDENDDEIVLKNKSKAQINENLSTTSSLINNNVITQPEAEINWRREAMIGNFMPAVVKLNRKEISVDEIVDEVTGNRLLHLACSYSYLNVTRCFIELFNCNINAKNIMGQTGLHIVCNNNYQDAYLLSYLLKNDMIQVNESDKSGVTPLFYAVLNKFNIAILALSYLRADLAHGDNYSNNVFYYALNADNKFAVNFFIQHKPAFDINKTYYKKEATLADVLITTKNSSCAKHLVKYYSKELNMISILSCRKSLESFNVYNKFNYDVLNTLFYFKKKDYFGFFKAMLNRETKDPQSHYYSYKMYNLGLFFYDLMMCNTGRTLKLGVMWIYSIILCAIFLMQFSFIHSQNFNNVLSIETLINIWEFSSILTLIICMLKFTLYKNKDEFYETSQYNLSNPEYATENVCHHIYQAMERNPLDLFFEEEICEICLIKKHKDTNHCHTCKKCVKDFYFHSQMLGLCFSKGNINLYILLLSSLASLHLSIMLMMFYIADLEKDNTLERKSIYESEYLLTNLIAFVINASAMKIIICLFMFVTAGLYFQKMMTNIICFGYKTTYYNMFRFHKRSVGVIQQRGNLYYNVPGMNLISIGGFFKNLIFGK